MKHQLKSTDNFIIKAKKIHGKLYNYSKVKYVNAVTPVSIICETHGEFLQRPDTHINRKSGCPTCGYLLRAATRKNKNKWLPYSKAKQIVTGLKLNNISEWNQLCSSGKRPEFVPAAPAITYSDEWEGWEQWIGINAKTKQFLSFDQSKELTYKFKLRSYEDWIHFCQLGKRPENIPFTPQHVYNDQWVSWGDWLGYKSRANGNLPGIIYVLQYEDTPNNVYKIGRTYRLDKRLYEHNRVSNTHISLIATFDVPNMNLDEKLAHKIANVFGKKYQYYRSKEHFQIEDINDVLAQYSKQL